MTPAEARAFNLSYSLAQYRRHTAGAREARRWARQQTDPIARLDGLAFASSLQADALCYLRIGTEAARNCLTREPAEA